MDCAATPLFLEEYGSRTADRNVDSMRYRIGGAIVAVFGAIVILVMVSHRSGIYVLARSGIYDSRLIYLPSPWAWIGVHRSGEGVISGGDGRSMLVIARGESDERRSTQWSHCIDLFDVNEGRSDWTRCFAVEFQPRKVSISRDRKFVAIRGRERFATQDRVFVIDTVSSKVVHRFAFDAPDDGAGICWLDGTSTLVIERGGVIRQATPPDWLEGSSFPGHSPVCVDKGLVYVNGDGRVRAISFDAGRVEKELPIDSAGDIRVSADGRRILFLERSRGYLKEWKAGDQSSSVVRFFPGREHPRDLEWILWGGSDQR